MKKLAALFVLLTFTLAAFFGCSGENPPKDPDEENRQTIRISGLDFPIFFGTSCGSGVRLADGKEYRSTDLLPVFSALSERLSVSFDVCDRGGDIVFGEASVLSRSGVFGDFLNLSDYLDLMPSLAAFLAENPDVHLSVSSDEEGSFYFLPYVSDAAECSLPLFNAEAVRALLDGDGEFTSESTATLGAAIYEPFMPTVGKLTVPITERGEIFELTKNYAAIGNIIELMNYEMAKAPLSANDAVNMLRSYIDDAYHGFYGECRSQLFLGETAAWDADELVALLRCAAALGGEYGSLFVFQGGSLAGLAGMLFSSHGLLSYNYLYNSADNGICDARLELESYDALLRMRNIIDEGLLSDGEEAEREAGLVTAMPPVSLRDGKCKRLVGGSAKIKNSGVAVSASVAESEEKLSAVLGFIDYLFSDDGELLARYGTDAFYAADGNRVAVSEKALSNASEYTDGDIKRFMREYVGAGVLFPYGDSDKTANGSYTDLNKAISLGVVERVGFITDEGVYLPQTPVRMYTREEYILCDSNSYYGSYSDIFDKILAGEKALRSLDEAKSLLAEIRLDDSYPDFLQLKSVEAERYLRSYKRIAK